MIDRVNMTETTWADLPHKHEAGTPNVAGAVGLAAAIHYVKGVGVDAIERYEVDLTSYMTDSLASVGNLKVFGPTANRASVFSVALGSAHPFDVGSLLDQLGIAVRTGHHCNQPLMARLGVPGTVRASLAFYNTREEIDRFVEGLLKIQTMLS
jgi:cysteine desulfurase/selenocysteine lyase